MDTYKLLLEGYVVFGIILTYTITFIIGMLIGERQAEKEFEYDKKIQGN